MNYNNRNAIFSFALSVSLCVIHFAAISGTCIEKKNLAVVNDFFSEVIYEHPVADSNSLKQALTDFMEKVDSGKFAEFVTYYDPNFLSIRVVDAGQVIKMDYNQMVYFWKMVLGKQVKSTGANRPAIVIQKTTIHYIEISGDTGYVLLTRIKDLGNGPEPMFYNLIWVNKNNKWYLLREIVHQRTMPNFH